MFCWEESLFYSWWLQRALLSTLMIWWLFHQIALELAITGQWTLNTTFTLLIENQMTLCCTFLDLLIHCAVLYFQSMVKVWWYVSIDRHRLQTDVQDTECYIRTEVWRLLSGVTSLHICKLHFHYMLSLRNTLYCHNLCKMSDISHAHKCYCSDLGQRTGQKLKR